MLYYDKKTFDENNNSGKTITCTFIFRFIVGIKIPLNMIHYIS